VEAEAGDQNRRPPPEGGWVAVGPVHDLRHFMATQMLEAGVPPATVSRHLDHKRVSTTLDRYAHAVPGGDAQASATLWAVIETAAAAGKRETELGQHPA